MTSLKQRQGGWWGDEGGEGEVREVRWARNVNFIPGSREETGINDLRSEDG